MLRAVLSKRWVRVSAGYVLSAAGLVLAWTFLVPKSAELRAIATVLSDADSWQLALGVVLELASIACYGLTTRALLASDRESIGRSWMVSLTIASTAIGNSLPLGAGISAVYAYRKIVHRGASPTAAGVALGATNVVAIVTLSFLVLVSTTFGSTSLPASLSPLTLAGLVLIVVLGVALVLRIGWVAGAVSFCVEFLRKWPREGHSAARVSASTARQRNGKIAFSLRTILWASLLSFFNWVFDLSALVLALVAVHAHVKPIGIVAAYFLGALAANLPITPGGLGVVEGSLAVALVSFGGKETPVLAAVLIYRLVSFWIWLPTGWVIHFVLAAKERARLVSKGAYIREDEITGAREITGVTTE